MGFKLWAAAATAITGLAGLGAVVASRWGLKEGRKVADDAQTDLSNWGVHAFGGVSGEEVAAAADREADLVAQVEELQNQVSAFTTQTPPAIAAPPAPGWSPTGNPYSPYPVPYVNPNIAGQVPTYANPGQMPSAEELQALVYGGEPGALAAGGAAAERERQGMYADVTAMQAANASG